MRDQPRYEPQPPPARTPATSLFDAEFLRKLELLEILFRRNTVGRREGDRPGQQRGGRSEFADYREYTPGDDLRTIDWNVYARTARLFVKEFTKHETATVCVLFDASASMGFGQPRKIDHARRLAAAFAYLALAGGNEAQLGAFAADEVRWSPRFAGKPDVRPLAEFLDPIQPAGPTHMFGALRAFADRLPERALLIVVSDLLDEGDGHAAPRRALRQLAARGHDLAVIHLLSPQELHPPAIGPVRLADCETGEGESLEVDAAALRLYADRLNAFCEGWRSFCERHDVRYVQASTAESFEQCVLDTLRKGGLVR